MGSISLRLTDNEILKLDTEASKSNLQRSDYIRKNLFNEAVQVIDKGEDFYRSLCAINDALSIVERSYPETDFSKVREELLKACQLLA